MIFLTGDTHGCLECFRNPIIRSKRIWTPDDYLIVAGDFGITIGDEQTDNEKVDALSHLPYNILFVDGNHEGFPKLNSYPELTWNGGKVHQLHKNVFHLMRGQVFEIDGICIFTMGGAYSPDRASRVKGISWWEEEMPSELDYDEARKNLMGHQNKVDLIVTHTAPYATLVALHTTGKLSIIEHHEFPLNRFLEEVAQSTEYKQWFFGHFHLDTYVWRGQRAIFNDICQITEDGDGCVAL